MSTTSEKVSLLGEVLDAMIERYSADDRVELVREARREYDKRRGRVFEDEDMWEKWSESFLEWYIVERVLVGHDFPPAAALLAVEDDPRIADAIRSWLTSHRSLFEAREVASDHVVLLDLLGGGEYSVAEQRSMRGVGEGDVIEVRLVGFEREVVFGRTFLFHPTGTRDAILGHARRISAEGGDRRDVIDYCASLRIRCERYKHVPAIRIYNAKPDEFQSSSPRPATTEADR